MEPVIRHTTHPDWESEFHDEPPKRRRKRKRRPTESSTEELTHQEIHTYPDAALPSYSETDYGNNHETTELPRRRRKRINARPNRWADDVLDSDRPIRRRTQRRKRPSFDPWAQSMEHYGRQRSEPSTGIDKNARSEDDEQQMGEKIYINNEDHREKYHQNNLPTEYENENPQKSHAELTPDIIMRDPNVEVVALPDVSVNSQINVPNMQEDKSLSEFSLEMTSSERRHNVEVENLSVQDKIRDPRINDETDNIQVRYDNRFF